MKEKKIDIKWYADRSLNEIYQSVEMKFAFLGAPKNGNMQCCAFAKCRDYLHDIVRAHLMKDSMSIYGMAWNHKEDPALDTKAMRMIVKKDGLKFPKEYNKKLEAAIRLLNHYEKLAKIKGRSKVVKVITDKDVWMFTSPSFWMKSPILVSMYTFLIRLGDKELKFKDNADLISKLQVLSEKCTYNGKSDNDCNYLKSNCNKMHLVVEHAKELFFYKSTWDPIYKAKHDINSFHNNAGVKCLCEFCTPDKELNVKFKKICKEASL